MVPARTVPASYLPAGLPPYPQPVNLGFGAQGARPFHRPEVEISASRVAATLLHTARAKREISVARIEISAFGLGREGTHPLARKPRFLRFRR